MFLCRFRVSNFSRVPRLDTSCHTLVTLYGLMYRFIYMVFVFVLLRSTHLQRRWPVWLSSAGSIVFLCINQLFAGFYKVEFYQMINGKIAKITVKTVLRYQMIIISLTRTAYEKTGGRLNIKMSSNQYRDPHVKIRRSHNRLIFNMGIPIPGKDGLYIETRLRSPGNNSQHCSCIVNSVRATAWIYVYNVCLFVAHLVSSW